MNRMTVVLIMIVAGMLLACETPAPETYEMEGTWNITTTHATGTALGSGSFTLSYLNDTEAGGTTYYIYSGSGVIGSSAYDFYLTCWSGSAGNFNMTIYTAGANISTASDWMDFDGTYTSGDPVYGSYDGEGTYMSNTGSFVVTRP